MNYVIETFLSVSFSGSSKQRLCFVDQGQKEQRTSSSSQTIALSESCSWLLTILFSEKKLSKTNHNSFTTPGETIASDCVVFALETTHEEFPLGCEILHHRWDSQLQFWQTHCLRFKQYCTYLNKSVNYVSYLIEHGVFRRSIYSAFDHRLHVSLSQGQSKSSTVWPYVRIPLTKCMSKCKYNPATQSFAKLREVFALKWPDRLKGK